MKYKVRLPQCCLWYTTNWYPGRLSKNLWTKVAEALPPAFKTLVIRFAENGAGHSWTMDHLCSLIDLPLDTLEELAVVRTHSSDTGTHALAHKELPQYIKDMLKTQRPSSLKVLRLDLWLSSVADVKTIAESCPSLQLLQILLDAQLPNLFSLTGPFAGLKQLSTLRVAVSPAHAPLPLDASSTSLPTPSASPTIASRIISTASNESDGPDILNGHDITDTSIPPLREVKKFVRKCSRLQILGKSFVPVCIFTNGKVKNGSDVAEEGIGKPTDQPRSRHH